MRQPTFIIRDEDVRERAVAFLKQLDLSKPWQLVVTPFKRNRSIEQNRLQRLWVGEISEYLKDQTAEEIRAYCKLRFGVPLLRAENESFCEKYDRLIKPLPYEAKIELMAEPFDFPVTRLMSAGQKTRYLDAMFKHFSEQGVVLTIPQGDTPQ